MMIGLGDSFITTPPPATVHSDGSATIVVGSGVNAYPAGTITQAQIQQLGVNLPNLIRSEHPACQVPDACLGTPGTGLPQNAALCSTLTNGATGIDQGQVDDGYCALSSLFLSHPGFLNAAQTLQLQQMIGASGASPEVGLGQVVAFGSLLPVLAIGGLILFMAVSE
jgi:hypothetical protein